MNIVIICDYARVEGGASQVALTSAIALAERGFRVTLFAGTGPVSSDLHRKNLRVICLEQHDLLSNPSRVAAARQGWWNVPAARAMTELLATLRPESTVVHLHSWTKVLSSSVVRAVLDADFPLVCTLHDYFTACPNGGFFDYPRNAICTLRPMSARCVTTQCDARGYGQKLWRVGRQAIQARRGRLSSGLRHFITVSAFSREILRPFLPADAELHALRNPVEVEQGAAVEVAHNRAFISVGRLSPEKGGALFAQASAELGVEAVLVGEGDCRDEIAELNPAARLLGWQPRSGVRAALHCARALVLPSRWYETQGLAVAEAAAMGVPAIVPDSSAARDAVEHGVTGLWFRGGDVGSLKAQMQRLQNPETAATLGRNAHARYWSEPSDMEHHVDGLLRVYRSVRAERGSR